MNVIPLRRWAAALLILEVLLVVIPSFVLQAAFDFPDILREPADVALARFSEEERTIRTAYYFYMLSGVVLIPLVIVLDRVLGRRASVLLAVATVFGIVSGVTQFLGFARWPFMISFLAEAYADPQSSAATRDAAAVTYEAFNRYAGVAVGEHLGFLSGALWLVLFSLVVLDGRALPRWTGLAGIGVGVAILASTPEQFGFARDALGPLNLIAVTAYVLWLIALAVILVRPPAAPVSDASA
jgi:hypothetical protein